MPNTELLPSSATSQPTLLTPVAPGERILTLHILRGVALFGVLVSDIWLWFSGIVFRFPEYNSEVWSSRRTVSPGNARRVLARSRVAVSKLASRARQRVQNALLAVRPDLKEPRRVAEAFLKAAREGNFENLLAVLDPEIVLRADGGALANASRVVHGAHTGKGANADDQPNR